MEKDTGVNLGPVAPVAGSLASVSGVEEIRGQVLAVTGKHSTPGGVIEGAAADRAVAEFERQQALDRGLPQKVIGRKVAKVEIIFAKGDRVKYTGQRGTQYVTVVKTNVGEIGKHEVVNGKGDRWRTHEKHLHSQ